MQVSTHRKSFACYDAKGNHEVHDQFVSEVNANMHTSALTTASGKPLCRYALRGAARSKQPSSLPLQYRDTLSRNMKLGSPFYFYYNPHRYPAFLFGVMSTFADDTASTIDRKDIFIAFGGSDRCIQDIDERLNDALKFSGGTYLDAFVLEYVCPEELIDNSPHYNTSSLEDTIVHAKLGPELEEAILYLRSLVLKGKIRYILASTHSHFTGAALSNSKIQSLPGLDAIMLRYNLSHKKAAESLSFPYALKNDIPVIAFTTTRWNQLLKKEPIYNETEPSIPPTSGECIKFVLQHPAIEIVLHSARDEDELNSTIASLAESRADEAATKWISDEEYEHWREYGSDEMRWNGEDSFDEYPEEMQ